MTVKASGQLSLASDVLPHLPAGATADGTQAIGSQPVTMSEFYAGTQGLPSSGQISFSEFYNVDNSVGTSTTTYFNTTYSFFDGGTETESFYQLGTTKATPWTNYVIGGGNTTYSFVVNTTVQTPYPIPEGSPVLVNTYKTTTKTISRQTLKFHYTQYLGG